MHTSILAELALKEAVSNASVDKLRKYISNKFPNLSSKEKALLFADALRRIIDSFLPNIDAAQKEHIKLSLFKETVNKTSYNIDYSDIFKQILKSKFIGNTFFKEVTHWLNDVLEREFKKENVFNFIINVYKAQNENPETEIDSIINQVESKYRLEVDEVREQEIKIHEVSEQKIIINQVSEEEIKLNETSKQETEIDVEIGQETEIEVADREIIEKNKYYSHNYNYSPNKNILYVNVDFLKLVLGHLKNNFVSKMIVGFLVAVSVTTGVLAGSMIYSEKQESVSIKNQDEDKSEIKQVLVKKIEPKIDEQIFIDQQPLEINKKKLQAIKVDAIKDRQKVSRAQEFGGKILTMKATAYDLSIQSCGKDRSHPFYGITSIGIRAKFGRTVAVDPKYIPLGSRLSIKFPEKYKYLDGIYIAEDTGSKVKGNIVDIFWGEDKVGSEYIKNQAMEFGVQQVKVRILD